MTKLILVRHCQARGNLERYFQGTIDSDITELGREQIQKTAELLREEPIDVLISSPKKRARLSAEGINVYHGLPIEIDDRIVEIDAGQWEGVPLKEIEGLYPEQYDNWFHHPEIFHAPGGESMKQVYDRVKPAVLDIVTKYRNQTICVVSHGCAIKNMMCFLHGWEIDKIAAVPIGTNMSVNVINFDEEFRPEVVLENYADHLQEGFRQKQ